MCLKLRILFLRMMSLNVFEGRLIFFCNMATLHHTCWLKWVCFSAIKWLYIMDQFEIILILIYGELFLLLKNLMLDSSSLLSNFNSEILFLCYIEKITKLFISSNIEYQVFQQYWELIFNKLTNIFFKIKPWWKCYYFPPTYGQRNQEPWKLYNLFRVW